MSSSKDSVLVLGDGVLDLWNVEEVTAEFNLEGRRNRVVLVLNVGLWLRVADVADGNEGGKVDKVVEKVLGVTANPPNRVLGVS